MNETVELLYCSNAGAYDGVMLSLLSVMRHTARPLSVKILTASFDCPGGEPVEKARASFMGELLCRRGDGSALVLEDVTELASALFTSEAACGAFTPYTLLRLIADLVYSDEKVLYLDADTMAAGDIGRVYDLDLEDGLVGGVRDALGSVFLSPFYLNAGVLLLDIPGIAADGAFTRARAFVRENKLRYPDQSALNYSDIPVTILPSFCNEQLHMRKDTVIRHFCRTVRFFPYPHVDRKKPWEKGGMRKNDRRAFINSYEEFLLQRDGRKTV